MKLRFGYHFFFFAYNSSIINFQCPKIPVYCSCNSHVSLNSIGEIQICIVYSIIRCIHENKQQLTKGRALWEPTNIHAPFGFEATRGAPCRRPESQIFILTLARVRLLPASDVCGRGIGWAPKPLLAGKNEHVANAEEETMV